LTQEHQKNESTDQPAKAANQKSGQKNQGGQKLIGNISKSLGAGGPINNRSHITSRKPTEDAYNFDKQTQNDKSKKSNPKRGAAKEAQNLSVP